MNNDSQSRGTSRSIVAKGGYRQLKITSTLPPPHSFHIFSWGFMVSLSLCLFPPIFLPTHIYMFCPAFSLSHRCNPPLLVIYHFPSLPGVPTFESPFFPSMPHTDDHFFASSILLTSIQPHNLVEFGFAFNSSGGAVLMKV